jgi:hypothetical protein
MASSSMNVEQVVAPPGVAFLRVSPNSANASTAEQQQGGGANTTTVVTPTSFADLTQDVDFDEEDEALMEEHTRLGTANFSLVGIRYVQVYYD